MKTIELSKTSIDSLGNFELTYTNNYKGMAYLETSDKGRLFLVLNEPDIVITSTHLNEPDSITFTNSLENKIFNQYAVEHNQREAALAGWKYLLPIYYDVKQFENQKYNLGLITGEIQRLESADSIFLANIDSSTYVSWFLPMRKFVDDMPLSTMRYIDRIPKHIEDFREIDFNDERLKTSGILDDILEGHFLMLENMGQPLDSIYNQMNKSIDYVLFNLVDNKIQLNEVADFLFELMEKRSLYISSEYLAIEILSNDTFDVDGELVDKLEIYRAMKVGNIAPEIMFDEGIVIGAENDKPIQSLDDIRGDYLLLVFGSGSCPGCIQEISKLKSYYSSWKSKGLDIVFVSLETENKTYIEHANSLPWISYCDLKGWETKPTIDYHVFGTPTMFLLDKDRKILVRPNSVEHEDAWVKYKM